MKACSGWPLGVLTLTSLAIVSGENTAQILVNAASSLAQLPFGNRGKDNGLVKSNAPNHDDLAISRLQDKVVEVVDQVWADISNPQKGAILGETGLAKVVVETFAQTLQSDIFALGTQVEASRIELGLRTLPLSRADAAEWNQKLHPNLQKVVGKINLHYTFLDGFMSDPESVTKIVLEDYARSIIQPGSSQTTAMLSALDKLNEMVIPMTNSDGSLLHASMRKDLLYKLYQAFSKSRNNEKMCSLDQTPGQFILAFYNFVALAEVKAYAMIQFSYMMLKVFGRANLTMESDLSRQKFITDAAYKISFAKEVLEQVSKDYWRCDPQQPQEGLTYLRLTELLQGHLENEVDMNSLGSCRDSCSTFKVAQPHRCYKNMFCAKQRPCTGRLFECQFFNADAWVCMSPDSSRRYDWIEYENGIKLGEQGQCKNKVKVDSWWRFLFHCSYCLCKCDAPGETSDRYWSLKPQVSNMTANMVVTGVRFVKENRTIHLAIEQGRALPEGGIASETRHWVDPVGVVNVEDSKRRDKDFMMMTYEDRALDTDHLKAPANHVVTGVKLRNLGGHLNLEVRVTPIDFKTGLLSPASSTWIGNDNTPATPEQRTKIEIPNPDVPTKFTGKSAIDSVNNKYILFDSTAAGKDVSQTTIPFIDSQPVTPKVGSWISGVGLYHKGSSGFGGYVGPMVTTYDTSKHLVAKSARRDEYS